VVLGAVVEGGILVVAVGVTGSLVVTVQVGLLVGAGVDIAGGSVVTVVAGNEVVVGGFWDVGDRMGVFVEMVETGF
jgi:hypothetical protein